MVPRFFLCHVEFSMIKWNNMCHTRNQGTELFRAIYAEVSKLNWNPGVRPGHATITYSGATIFQVRLGRSNDLSGSSRWKMQLGVSCASPLHHSTEFLINCDLRKLMMALGNLSGSIVRLQACHDPPGLQKLELSWMRITYSGATIFEAGLQLGQVSTWSPVEFRRTQRFFSVQRLHGFRQVVQHVWDHVAIGINWLIKSCVSRFCRVAAKVNWWRTDT